MESITTLEGKEELVSSMVGSDAIILSADHHPTWAYCTLKRLFDIVVAVVALIVLAPIFFIIAVCIKLEDGGSIFYFRERIGLHGRRFEIMKFRTMIPNAEAYLEQHPELKSEYQKQMKLQNDPRITRLGKFLRKTYLDELPQLFNVLLGQLSFVGPRAIHDFEEPLYGKYAAKRHSVKPGLTGLWQISPNKYSDYQARIPLDMRYIDNRSFFLDLIILLKTPKALIISKGV